MKMFNYKFLGFLFAAFVFSSCKKNFLETFPTTAVAATDAVASTKNGYAALNGIHRIMYVQYDAQGQAGEGTNNIYRDLLGEDIVYPLANGSTGLIGFLRWTTHRNVNDGFLRYMYRYYYRIIANANVLINGIDGAEGADLDKKIIKGQALAYRAWGHFQLVQLWGKRYVGGSANNQPGVPLLLTNILEGQPRASVEEVYTQVNKDLDDAIVLLEGYTRIGSAAKSNLNVNVARALKARVALTQQNWDVAATSAAAARTGHALMDTVAYKSGFNNITNSEWIWGSRQIDDHNTFFYSYFAYISANFNSTVIRTQPRAINSVLWTAIPVSDVRKRMWDHNVDVLVGHESFNQMETDVNGFKQGQSLTGNTELGNFTTINSLGSSLDRYRIESYFSRVNYDFLNRYFISASLRRDGNSRFASESRWGTFYSVGGGWNMEKENFMSNIRFLDVLKLRGSYGVVGVADGIGLYAYQGLYVFANNANEPGIVQSQTAFLNRELTWEVNKQFDIGIDFTLFKNRINGSFEFYNRVSSDLLFAVPQPLSSGALTVNQNTATMYNRGIEVQLGADIVRTRNFTWNTNINISTVTNRITKMPESVPEFITGTKKYAVDHSIFDYWLRTYYGVDPVDGAALYVADNKSLATNRRLITNKDGGVDTVTTNIANGKFEYHGGTIPDFYGSFSQGITFKGITLNALFTFQVGGKTFDGLYQSLMATGNYGGALHTDILKRWQKAGDVTDVPRMDAGRSTDHNATSSRWLTDASYLNIRSISLGYNLPQSWMSKAKITNAQIFVSAENVAFFSKRKGMNNQQAFSGVTSNAYPPARVITAGLTLNL